MNLTKEDMAKGGRNSSRKGIPNKTTAEIREGFQLLVENNLDKIEIWLDKVAQENPLKALEIIHKFGEYILPKLSRAEVENVSSIEELLRMSPEDRKKRIIELKMEINNNSLKKEKWNN